MWWFQLPLCQLAGCCYPSQQLALKQKTSVTLWDWLNLYTFPTIFLSMETPPFWIWWQQTSLPMYLALCLPQLVHQIMCLQRSTSLEQFSETSLSAGKSGSSLRQTSSHHTSGIVSYIYQLWCELSMGIIPHILHLMHTFIHFCFQLSYPSSCPWYSESCG